MTEERVYEVGVEPKEAEAPGDSSGERAVRVGVGGWASRDGFYLITTSVLLSVQAYRLSQSPSLPWWSLLIAIPFGFFGADFISGLYHWAADTWGHEGTPWLGPRFIEPFRVHHRTAEPLLACTSIECVGDTALMAIPWLTLAFFFELSDVAAWTVLLMVSTFIWVMPTNLIHKWAHMEAPPAIARWLQTSRLVLSHAEHAKHHRAPHLTRYCITNGSLNPLLDAVGFWRLLEAIVSRLTGAKARAHTA